MPAPKVPVWGDAQRLEQLGSGLKRQGGTYGPVVQRNPAGRPTEGATAEERPTQGAGVTDEVKQLYSASAKAEWVRQYWTMMAQRFPGTATEYWAARADLMAKQIHAGTYQATGNFEF